MNVLTVFEQRIGAIFEGNIPGVQQPFSFKRLAKRAVREMEDETFVIDGVDTAPALYTILVSPQDDEVMRPIYVTVTNEISQLVEAQAKKRGYTFVGRPLVRFMVDPSQRPGKFSVFAENIDPRTLARLRDEERAYLGITPPREIHANGGFVPEPVPVREMEPAPVAQEVAYVPEERLAPEPAFAPVQEPAFEQEPAFAPGPEFAPEPAFEQEPAFAPGPEFAPEPAFEQETEFAPEPAFEQEPEFAPEQEPEFAPEPAFEQEPAPSFEPEPAFAPEPEPVFTPAPVHTPEPAAVPERVINPAVAAAVASVGAHARVEQPVDDEDAGLFTMPASTPAQEPKPEPQPEPRPQPEPEPEPSCTLVDLETNKSFHVTADHALIGRERTAGGIILHDPNVSRRHAEVFFDRGAWHIRDLNSTNGTLVNDMDVAEAVLCDRDILTIGLTNLEFRAR